MRSGKMALMEGLKEINTESCLNLLKSLDQAKTQSLSLHLRDSNLTAKDVVILGKSFKELQKHKDIKISSISLSYNPNIGDDGISQLLKSTPYDLKELGLVGCELTDLSGGDLFIWLQRNKQLRLLCIEGNNFSKELTSDFRDYAEKCEFLYLEI